MCNRNTSVLRHALTAAVALAVCGANSFALGDEAAQIGREGQAFGKQLSNEFSFPTESGGSFNLGNGTTIGPSDLAPSGDGLYVQDPDVQGMQGVYDSDHDMDVTGRAAQGKLYSDAQAKGNPFDPDPAKRDAPGPSTVSGAAYQVILGVSDARNEFPDLSNDPIISNSGSAMLDDSLLESFGDCKVETQVTESTRPVRVPEEEFCERVIKPAASSCQVKHELEIEEEVTWGGGTYSYVVGYAPVNAYRSVVFLKLVRESDAAIVWEGTWPAEYHNEAREIVAEYIHSPFWGFGNQQCPLMGFASVADCKNAAVINQDAKYNFHYTGASSFEILHFNTTTRKLIIKTDRWYPEECVERALKASS